MSRPGGRSARRLQPPGSCTLRQADKDPVPREEKARQSRNVTPARTRTAVLRGFEWSVGARTVDADQVIRCTDARIRVDWDYSVHGWPTRLKWRL